MEMNRIRTAHGLKDPVQWGRKLQRERVASMKEKDGKEGWNNGKAHHKVSCKVQ